MSNSPWSGWKWSRGVRERKKIQLEKKNHKKDGFILQTLFVNNYITFWMFWLTFEPFYVIIFLNPWVLSLYRKIRTREKPVYWHILPRGRNLICWYFYFVRQRCSLLVLSLKERFFLETQITLFPKRLSVSTLLHTSQELLVSKRRMRDIFEGIMESL